VGGGDEAYGAFLVDGCVAVYGPGEFVA
jgi:hypothetical protein